VFAMEEARMLKHNYVGTEHILLGLVRKGEEVAVQVLIALGADLDRVRQAVPQLLSRRTSDDEATEHPIHAPTCLHCFAALDDTLAIQTVEAAGEEPTPVKIA
jgi:ATP-dependent Clp protease ATP-binding subunit ClpA